MTSGCTRAKSFLPKLQLSVRLSLDFSLVPYIDADWRPLVCFEPTNRRSKNVGSRSFRSAMPETSFALVHREPCQVGNRFALFHVSPNVHWVFFTFSFSQSQVKLPVDRLGEAEGAPQFQERRCSVDLHWLNPASPLARRCRSDKGVLC